MLWLRFGEETTGHGHSGDALQAVEWHFGRLHSGDALQAVEWHFGRLGDGGEGDAQGARWKRNVAEDVEVEEPVKIR